jgi:DNA-binding NtrC family response regulator
MRKPSAVETQTSATGTLKVLYASATDEDHLSLEAIVGHSRWMLFRARDLGSTLTLLREHEIAVLLCERDLLPGTWTDVLEHIQALPNAPSLIVASRLADDRLWAEALNLGAWDVLAKPFDHIEVIRSVKSAWQHWYDRIHLRAKAATSMSEAS